MAFGFELYDSSGSVVMSSEEFSVMIVDIITVASTDTDSVQYSGTLASNIVVAQSQELEAVDMGNITVFNQMDVTVSEAAGVWTVAWAPGQSITAARDVTLYVLGY